MTAIFDPIGIVRECKGAALAILWLLTVVRQAVTQEWLERRSGYTDKPVSQALALLAEKQLVTHTSAGWMLQEGAQLYLPIDSSRNNSDSINNDIKSDSEKEKVIINSETRNFSASEQALGRLGIAITDKTRPLLALSTSEIQTGKNRAWRAGHDECGYIITVLLGMLQTKTHGKKYTRCGQDYLDWDN